jgi:hypothetical protein
MGRLINVLSEQFVNISGLRQYKPNCFIVPRLFGGSFTGLCRHTNVGIGLYYPSQFRVYFEGTRLALNVNGCCTYMCVLSDFWQQ